MKVMFEVTVPPHADARKVEASLRRISRTLYHRGIEDYDTAQVIRQVADGLEQAADLHHLAEVAKLGVRG